VSNEKELSIKLLLDDKEALSKLNAALRKVEGESKKSADSMNLSWAGVASQYYLAQQALAPVISFMGQAVKAANDQEDAIARLNVALANQGFTSTAVSQAYQDMANQLQATTRFSDDAILAAQQTLVTFGNVGPESMERVTKAVLDLATAKRISLDSAATIVSKALSGQIGVLKKLGITIEETTDATKLYASVLGAIEGKAGGAAQKDVEAFAGAQAKLANSWNEVTEQIGFLITKSPAAKKALDDMTVGATNLAEGLAKVQKQNPDLLADTVSKIGSFLTKDMGMLTGLSGLGQMAGQSLAARMLGTPEQNTQDAQKALAATAAAEELGKQEQLAKAEATRNAKLQAEANQLFNTEQMNLLTVTQGTEVRKQIKEQETLDFITKEQLKIDALLKTANIDIATQQKLMQQKEALAEVLKKKEMEKNKVLADAEIAKFKLQLELATATADLTAALATATGSSALKGVSIVLNAVVAAAQAMIAIRAAANPLDAAIAGVKLATIAVTAANAFAQINAGQKALEASKNQSIQPVTNIPGLFMGGEILRAGATLVGERGPEILDLPTGARVTPLSGSSAGGGKNYQITVTINNPVFAPGDLSDQLVAQIGPKISQFLDDERTRL